MMGCQKHLDVGMGLQRQWRARPINHKHQHVLRTHRWLLLHRQPRRAITPRWCWVWGVRSPHHGFLGPANGLTKLPRIHRVRAKMRQASIECIEHNLADSLAIGNARTVRYGEGCSLWAGERTSRQIPITL
jgi:hypothetical protein